ncbi:MAG: hypothetical protein AM325_006870 [Candidatus Thorarchaeota archaeon SMTZ1-45]|nr:MAG: hypothetical protein AM325_08610 [Candidatus Thorarchaeota archaeon SMTZ1-45]
MSYEELRKTDLFSFFNFSESGRRQIADGMQEIYLKPGGFQEFIDIKMKVDRFQKVFQGVLYLDRDWIGGPMTISPFGKDLAKSFIAAITPPTDRKKADNIVTTIWNLHGPSDGMVALQPQKPKDLAKEPLIEKLENVYLGVEDKFEMKLEKSLITIENVTDVGRKRLKISIESI